MAWMVWLSLPTVLVSGALGVIAYLTGNYQFATYLHIPFISGAGELLDISPLR